MWIDSTARACIPFMADCSGSIWSWFGRVFTQMLTYGLESLFEVARDVSTRGHTFKLAIPVCQSEVRRRSFVVRVVSVWNSLPSRDVEAGSVECRRVDIILGSKLLDTI